MTARVAAALLAIAGAGLCLSLSAAAESNRDGDLLVTFDGSLHPKMLPRDAPAPVAIRVAGNVRSVSGEAGAIPQLRTISVGINREGRLFDRGLPICRVRAIRAATQKAARRICEDAIVGSGHIRVQVRIPGQLPFAVNANLLAFNGPRQGGSKLIIAQTYSRRPPGSFILLFRVDRAPGLFGTVLSTVLPRRARNWAFLTHFDMTLHRRYSYRGEPRSFVSAACAAPSGFDTVVFPLARATYGFANGQRLVTSVARTCHVG